MMSVDNNVLVRNKGAFKWAGHNNMSTDNNMPES